MLMQMIDYLIEQDPSLSARRTIDVRRYIVNRWNRTHEDPINEDAVQPSEGRSDGGHGAAHPGDGDRSVP